MPAWLVYIIVYALGSIPTAYILVRYKYHQDIRRMGSGNVGTMNVRNRLGYGPAAVVFLLDLAKGGLAVWLCLLFLANPHVGLTLAVAGHIYPPWLGFQGGRGLATALGGLVALGEFPAPLVFGLIWLPSYRFVFRNDSDRANLAGAVSVMVYFLLRGPNWAMALMTLLIAGRHYQAIRTEAGAPDKFK